MASADVAYESRKFSLHVCACYLKMRQNNHPCIWKKQLKFGRKKARKSFVLGFIGKNYNKLASWDEAES